MSIHLNKSKSYGIVQPPEHGAHYFQNGLYFDAQGERVTEGPLAATEDSDALVDLEAEALAQEAAEKAKAAFLAAKGRKPQHAAKKPAEAKPEAKAPGAPVEGEIDLTAWLKGGEKHIFGKVKQAIADKYGFNAGSKDQAIAFLTTENDGPKLIDRSDVTI